LPYFSTQNSITHIWTAKRIINRILERNQDWVCHCVIIITITITTMVILKTVMRTTAVAFSSTERILSEVVRRNIKLSRRISARSLSKRWCRSKSRLRKQRESLGWNSPRLKRFCRRTRKKDELGRRKRDNENQNAMGIVMAAICTRITTIIQYWSDMQIAIIIM